MLSRLAAGALLGTALLLAQGEGAARADDPPQAPVTTPAPAPAPAVPAPQPQAQPRGAVVVATSEGAGPAARALAFDVYRDPDLLPAVDDATAHVLAGEVPGDTAPPRLKEIAELRASIVHAGSELVARRLLASLGTELGATLVISVALDGTRPVARVLHPATAAFERVELGPTVDIAADGARTFRWPGAVATLHALLPAVAAPPATPPAAPPLVGPIPPAPPPAGPLAPKAESAAAPPAPGEPRPFYKSPWFWGSVGGAAAVGLSVFLISRATSSATTDVHLTGKVGP